MYLWIVVQKADKKQLEGKVNHHLFDTTTAVMNRNILDRLSNSVSIFMELFQIVDLAPTLPFHDDTFFYFSWFNFFFLNISESNINNFF